jgi:hypothetical protein
MNTHRAAGFPIGSQPFPAPLFDFSVRPFFRFEFCGGLSLASPVPPVLDGEQEGHRSAGDKHYSKDIPEFTRYSVKEKRPKQQEQDRCIECVDQNLFHGCGHLADCFWCSGSGYRVTLQEGKPL